MTRRERPDAGARAGGDSVCQGRRSAATIRGRRQAPARSGGRPPTLPAMHLRALPLLAAAAPALLAVAGAHGQDGGRPAGGEDRSVIADMFDYDNAGLIGYAIVGLSILALALVIESAVNLRRDRLAPPRLIDELDGLFDAGNFQAAAELCDQDRNYLTRCVGAGLARVGQPFETIQTSVREMETEEAIKLFQKIGWLSLLSTIAPMMGLFGTVCGMFVTFGTIARAGSVTPATLAGGIKMALITTIFGLCVAIPVGVAFYMLKNRVIRLATEVNAIAEEMFERFRAR